MKGLKRLILGFIAGLIIGVFLGTWFGTNIYNNKPLLSRPFIQPSFQKRLKQTGGAVLEKSGEVLEKSGQALEKSGKAIKEKMKK